MSETEWDYVVVGSGAAGSVVAGRLSENLGIRVLLLEAGSTDSYFPFHIPGMGFLASSRKADNWWFETEPSTELNGRRQIWLQGKVVGGSSSINGMIYNRGHAREYDYWAQMGCEGWSFSDILPYFKKSEANQRGDSEWHSGSGAVPIRKSGSALPIYDDFLQACASNGLPTLDDLNRNTVDGFGYYDVNIKGGRRMSAAASYLEPALRRRNLTVLTGALARRVVFEGRRAIGVEIVHGGTVRTVRARAEVIICAGGIKSPQLLMLSGIGPVAHLAVHGIDVLLDSPHVGANLQNHPSYRMQYACSGRSTAYNYLTPSGMIQSAANYMLSRGGGLGESIFGVGGFFRSRSDLEIPDIQVVMCGALLSKPTNERPTLWEMLPKQQGFALVVYQGTPFSRGSVTLRSADPTAPPVVDSGYFRDSRDIHVLIAGIKRMREVCIGRDKPRYVVKELAPGPEIRTDGELERDIRDNVSTSYHQCGTCAMGGQPSSVLDPRLRVRGVEGLRVADASVMPVMPNAALHGPVMMIGEKAAAMIAEDAVARSGTRIAA